MTDLEKMIRDKQDELRGRKEDWIDRFVAWERRQDWFENILWVLYILNLLLIPLMYFYFVWHLS